MTIVKREPLDDFQTDSSYLDQFMVRFAPCLYFIYKSRSVHSWISSRTREFFHYSLVIPNMQR